MDISWSLSAKNLFTLCGARESTLDILSEINLDAYKLLNLLE